MGRYTGIALDGVRINSGSAVLDTMRVKGAAPPAIKTAATYSVGASDSYLIFNGAAANVTVTLPAASSNTGRVINVKNLSGTYTVISASSNVKPIGSDSAGTAILAASAGAWAQLVSDGTNWVVMAS